MRDVDTGRDVSFEYRLDPRTGKAVQVAGPARANDEVILSPWDGVMGPEIAKYHGMDFKPVPKGGRRLTPDDGVDFLLAVLVKYARNTGYGRVEPISR